MIGKQISLDGVEYEVRSLPQNCQALLQKLDFVRLGLGDFEKRYAVLSKAKNAYLEDLRSELVLGRTGVDLDSLFTGD